MTGKKNWYIVDGYRPPEQSGEVEYEGHECVMVLNCNDKDAHCMMDVYFMDRDPVLSIKFTAPARRISTFLSNDKNVMGDVDLKVNLQYSLRIRSDIGVIVQYGRCDISQSNLAYIATLGFPE